MSDSSDDMEFYSGFCDEEQDLEDVVFELLERVNKLEKKIETLINPFNGVKIPDRKSILDTTRTEAENED